jgi:membrane AbrB-like protein
MPTSAPTTQAHRTALTRAVLWAGLGLATGLAGWGLGAVGLPSSYLFAALLVGIAAALWGRAELDVPHGAFVAAQAVTGVTLGAYLQASSLSTLAAAWLPVTLVCAGTLGLSLGTGVLLSRTTGVDPPTAALGMVAGGASGIVTMASDLGADDRLVAFMQYLRVLVVVLLMPLVVAFAFPGHHGEGVQLAHEAVLGDPGDWIATLLLAPAGLLAGRAIRLPAAPLLGPTILTGMVVLAGVDLAVPPLLREVAFVLIGLQVGLRFTVATLRQMGRLLVPVLLSVLALMAACFGLAELLAATTSASLLDAYLATTPGGLYAVAAAALGTGADSTFIIAVQSLRLLVMVLLAPAAVRWVVGRPARL